MNTIKQSILFIILFLGLSACDNKSTTITAPVEDTVDFSIQAPSLGSMQTAQGEKIKVRLAITPDQQEQGLSGLKPNEFAADESMLFFNTEDSPRVFWMPDTYFDLDIFFLDKDLKILSVERDVPHHVGRENLDKVYRTQTHYCRHVLELKSDSPIAKKIQTGDQLTWLSSPSLLQIESKIRQRQ